MVFDDFKTEVRASIRDVNGSAQTANDAVKALALQLQNAQKSVDENRQDFKTLDLIVRKQGEWIEAQKQLDAAKR